MHMLQRLWDPNEGGILIDGQDLRDVTKDSLRNSIGVVFQESLLFNRSIRENLLVGRPDATRRRSKTPANWPKRTSSSSASPTATTPWSANAAQPSPAASASAWRSPAPC